MFPFKSSVQCDEQHVWATCAVSGVSLIMWSVLNLSTLGIHSASSCPVFSTSGTGTGGMQLVRYTAQCVLCKVYFSAQPNKLRPILKFEKY